MKEALDRSREKIGFRLNSVLGYVITVENEMTLAVDRIQS